ncbi:hypothetical protein GCM10009737_11220 [Nocardioides lentus]|uniref:Glycosyltransferase RgtA/B/C/D-like domain-containing protein n=1 Tax=Nocardioides lentus TaxID=338077 RepID=A0ABN2P655_9ACTN
MIPGVSTSTRPAPAPAASRAPARWREVEQRHLVVGSAVVLVLVQTGWRAWASAGAWWYADDFILLEDARRSGLSLAALVQPHDSQLMPLGRLLAWSAGRAGDLAWWPGALQLVGLQLAAGLAAVWMLVRLAGPRPAILAPLAFYLVSPLTLTAYLWWAAALNQLPLHLAFFLAVGCHVTYLRTGRQRWALLAALAVTLGMTAYVKAALVLPVLLVLSLGPFASGGIPARLRTVAGQWRAWAVYGVLGASYAAAYTRWVPSPVAEGAPTDWSGLVRAMVGESLGSVSLGGPWRWSTENPPLLQVDVPGPVAVLSWVVIVAALGAALVVLRRRGVRTAPVSAALLVVGWVGGALVLVGLGRAPQLGAFVGYELRYLADSAMVVTLALALWCLPVAGADAATAATAAPGSRPVAAPARTRAGLPAALRPVAAVAALVLLAGAAWSSSTYAAAWHRPYATRAFVERAAQAADERPRTVADVPVPASVMAGTAFPDNLPSRLLGSLPRVRAVAAGTDLETLDAGGTPVRAAVVAGAESPAGPQDGCGYRVGAEAVTVPVEGDAEFFWWATVSYLASADTTLTLGLGEREERVEVLAGLHTLFLRGEGGWGPVRLQGSDEAVVCVDSVRVGDLVPAGVPR